MLPIACCQLPIQNEIFEMYTMELVQNTLLFHNFHLLQFFNLAPSS